MKHIVWVPIASVVFGIIVGVTGGIVSAGTAGGQSFVITVPLPKTAVDLELTPGGRLILWSDGTITTESTGCPEDIDGDGVVAIPDLLLLNAAMGKECP